MEQVTPMNFGRGQRVCIFVLKPLPSKDRPMAYANPPCACQYSVIYSREGTQDSNQNHPLALEDMLLRHKGERKNNNKLCAEDHYVMLMSLW